MATKPTPQKVTAKKPKGTKMRPYMPPFVDPKNNTGKYMGDAIDKVLVKHGYPKGTAYIVFTVGSYTDEDGDDAGHGRIFRRALGMKAAQYQNAQELHNLIEEYMEQVTI